MFKLLPSTVLTLLFLLSLSKSSEAQIFIPFSFWKNLCTSGPVVFNHTGADQIYAIPAGCNSMRVLAWGGGGGAGGGGAVVGGAGGGGGFSEATITVTPGNNYAIRVGGGGGGGIGNSYGAGGGGGGYSGVFTSPGLIAQVIAAGGGGGGDNATGAQNNIVGAGGAGGGTTGVNGENNYQANSRGNGGTSITGGVAGSLIQNAPSPIQPTNGASLQGGIGGRDSDTVARALGTGGTYGGGNGGAGTSNNSRPGGGGGGGGYFGGGGANAANTGTASAAGGGGGSSFSIVAGTQTSGSGTTPGNSTESLRGTAGNGAPSPATNANGTAGNNGRVVLFLFR
ncbi:hypothetical protein K2P97_13625 [bacterium]|nr:hypothetical protein [bacterium]